MRKKANQQIVVSCPIKCVNEYLIEFTDHYLSLGFDKIYFYDNNDDDDIQPVELLKEYIQKGKVEVVDYRNMVFNDVLHRNDFFKYYDFSWVLFVDDDEFLELKKHKDIREFLSSFDDDVTKIAINNLHYGDNEKCYYEEGRVQDIFSEPLPLNSYVDYYTFNSAIKSFLKKTDGTFILNAHSLINDKPYYNVENKKISLRDFWNIDDREVTYTTAYIKHYCTKSLEEFIRSKIKRVKKNSLDRMTNRYSIDNYYFLYNKRTKEKEELIDYFIEKYL